MRILFIFALATLLSTGTALAAVDYNFVPIAPLPAPGGGVATESGSIPAYIDAAFQIALAVGAVFAVINIAIGGFEYILSEAMTNKADGKKRIQQALAGLLILLMVYLILFVINPEILSLDFLK